MSQNVEYVSGNKEKNKKGSSRQISKKLDLKSSQRKDLQDEKENMIVNHKHSQVKWKKKRKEEYFCCQLLHVEKHNWFRDILRSYSKRPYPGASTVHMID